MRRRAVTAGLALTVFAGAAVALAASQPAVGVPGAVRAPEPIALAVSAADRAAASGLDALRKGPDEQFDRRAVYTGGSAGRDLFYVSYERTYRGLPVVGGDAVVATDAAGRVLSTVSANQGTLTLDTRPAVSAETALATARARLTSVDRVDGNALVVLAGGAGRLAYETVVVGRNGAAPSRLHVFTDAATGVVVRASDDAAAGEGTAKWSGPNPLTIDTTHSGSSYTTADPNRPGLKCVDYSGGAVFSHTVDKFGSGSGTDKETGCVDALFAAQREWDMVKNWLGRNGLDGNGNGWTMQVGLSAVNAYWTGDHLEFGHNNANEWITSLDVVGHENGHGIDQYTPGGTSQEAGLGEGTGDIFGALTEAYANEPSPYDDPDYTVGEKINLNGSGPIRNMYNPSLVSGDPNCYSSSIPNTEVHKAAGPLNHWFYLVAEGSAPAGKPASPTCDSSAVTGIGVREAGRVFYNAMLLKTSGMTYKKYRVATLQAAKNLDPTCAQFAVVKAAWDAVSLPAQPGEATCSASPGNEFSLALSPASGSVQPGSSVTATVGTTTTSGTAQTVALSASGAPAGVTVSFSPASVQSGASSTMTVAVAANAAAGGSTITVTGAGATTHTASYALTVGSANPGPGVPDIDVAKVRAHLAQLQTIATNNGGNRRAGSAGHTQSVSYLEQKLTAAGFTVSKQTCTTCTGSSQNLIADWPGGDANATVMFGAHLDSVSAGPGINDNGSGSAAILEVALNLAAANPTMSKHVRFGWWTDEEQGLVGSKFYVNSLSSAQRSAIRGYYNFDMIASKNGGYFINNLTTAASAPLKAYWDSLNLAPQENVEGQGRSDDSSFQTGGIPTSGYATGANATKSSAEASKWGGTAGQAYDSCYHQSCDTSANINDTALDRSSDGIAYTVWNLAVGTSTPTNDFSVAVSPTAGSVQAGGQLTATVGTTTTSGSAQTVALAAAGAPAGVTVGFSPASVTSGSGSTMTVAASASAVAGTYTLTVTGTGSASHSTTFSLTVTGTTPPGGRTFRADTDYPILDNQRIYSPVSSDAAGPAGNPVTVKLAITHTCAEDLGITLVAPGGALYTLKYSGGGSCTAWSGERSFTVANVSSAAAGTWQLRVTDYGPGDTGTLDYWAVTV